MSEIAQKKYEEAPARKIENKTDSVIQKKLFSIIFVFVSFVVLYFAVVSENEPFMYGGLGLLALSQVVMYLRN